MLTMEIDYEKLADALAPKLLGGLQEIVDRQLENQEIPYMLTIDQLMKFLHIKRWKASELLGRSDFPVLREAGVLIPRDKLFEWIDRNLDWVEDNTGYFKAV
ncbi:DNA-binding protein [Sporosarcina sp. FSL W7-1283]|uniref:DNA-binding protein n=2 Tax=Sporosarcina sp. FSL W7-1283 TaxID=2921560 RepID=UPI0030F7F850